MLYETADHQPDITKAREGTHKGVFRGIAPTWAADRAERLRHTRVEEGNSGPGRGIAVAECLTDRKNR
jgi:hypothetical protein